MRSFGRLAFVTGLVGLRMEETASRAGDQLYLGGAESFRQSKDWNSQ